MSSSAPSIAPDVSALVTEDDAPVDNLYSEKQQRLLTSTLYASWAGPPPEEDGAARTFLAAANVGVFVSVHEPPLVPDVFVSADVVAHPDIWLKEHRSYFVWEFGKAPEVVIEVVSNHEGGELGKRKLGYRRMGVAHYVVWDPTQSLGGATLHAFELAGSMYRVSRGAHIEPLGLSLRVWRGVFEGLEADWLRWCDAAGELIPTAAERAERETERAEREAERAEREAERAEREAERAEREATSATNERVLREAAEREVAALRIELERLRGR